MSPSTAKLLRAAVAHELDQFERYKRTGVRPSYVKDEPYRLNERDL